MLLHLPVPERHESNDSLFGGTVLEDHSVEPTFIGRELENEEWNVLNGWVYVPMPEDRIWVPLSWLIQARSNTTCSVEGAATVNTVWAAATAAISVVAV